MLSTAPLVVVHDAQTVPLRGNELLAGGCMRLDERADLVERVLIFCLDLHAGDRQLGAVAVDVVGEFDGGIEPV